MDLKTLREYVSTFKVKDVQAFMKEIEQMKLNAELYWGDGHAVSLAGQQLYQEAQLKLEEVISFFFSFHSPISNKDCLM